MRLLALSRCFMASRACRGLWNEYSSGNARARARGSDVRWVPFDASGETCVVVAGPAPALESLHTQGLIPLSSPEQLRALEAFLDGEPPAED
jgi:hypothetical protein